MKELESAFNNLVGVCINSKLTYPEHLQVQEDLKLIKDKLFGPTIEQKQETLKAVLDKKE
jgi:hypothetical protein